MNTQAQQSTVYQDEIPNYTRTVDSSISTLSARHAKVRVNGHQSRWMKELANRFQSLTELQRGWDGYDGRPVSFACATFAANLIERLYESDVPAPNLVPGSDGTLQIEWHRNNYDVEIDVLGPFKVNAYRYNQLTEKEDEFTLDTDFTALSEWVSALR